MEKSKFLLYEYLFNRVVENGIMEIMQDAGIDDRKKSLDYVIDYSQQIMKEFKDDTTEELFP